MYLQISKKSRKPSRNRCARYKAKQTAKDRARRARIYQTA